MRKGASNPGGGQRRLPRGGHGSSNTHRSQMEREWPELNPRGEKEPGHFRELTERQERYLNTCWSKDR